MFNRDYCKLSRGDSLLRLCSSFIAQIVKLVEGIVMLPVDVYTKTDRDILVVREA